MRLCFDVSYTRRMSEKAARRLPAEMRTCIQGKCVECTTRVRIEAFVFPTSRDFVQTATFSLDSIPATQLQDGLEQITGQKGGQG